LNRNVESHFSQLPAAQIQRSTFDRSASYKTSFDVGDIIPFYVEEVLPGDTFDITTAKVVRSQTMLSPVMDSIFLDTYYFYVPNRLLWNHWREFCGENTAGAWAPTVEYTIPTIESPPGGFEVGTIADYMGLPVGVEWKASDELAPYALPFRAYALICNEFFRDQNVSDPLLIPLDDANQVGTNGGNYISDVANGGLPFKAAKYHDAFTSALPAPQKGAAVGIPIDVPVFSGGVFPVTAVPEYTTPARAYPMIMASGRPGSNGNFNPPKDYAVSGLNSLTQTDGQGSYFLSNSGSMQPTISFNSPINLAVDIPQESSGIASAEFSVNELRLAFAYQRYLESIARSGSRYQEILLGLYGVKSPDASLQRPEYLGGNRIPINVHEVTSTAQTERDFLGDLGAKSQTGDVSHDVVKSFSEFGFIIGVFVARYDHSYSQGLQRHWMRKTFTDFYNPKFANLGEVPVYQAELYANDNFTKDRVFGYQEIWSEYRYRPNMVTCTMRPGVVNTLDFWHLSDYYEEAPTLSDSWIREDKTNVDRVLAVTSDVSYQFWADIYIQNKCTRPMPMYSVPGLIDHF
jgi:hypothetical protein